MKTIKDLFINNEHDCDFVEYPISKRYYLWIERNVDFENKDNVLIEIHEYVGENSTDFIDTLSCDFNLDTPLSMLKLKNIKQICNYVL